MEHGKYYERFKRWFNMEEQNRPHADTERLYDRTEALSAAFEELGKLRLENERLRTMVRNRTAWLEQAKEDAGFDDNVSFDDVFSELLEVYNKHRPS